MHRHLTLLALAALLPAWGCSSQELAGLLKNTKVSMKLKNGETIEGKVLDDGNGGSALQVKYGTVTVTSGEIASVEEHGPAPVPTTGAGRLARWDRCLHSLVNMKPSLPDISPIAATVIDRGIFKSVPYLSHRFDDLEFNIYGDPDAPAALEIGIYNRAPAQDVRRLCLAAISDLLNDPADRDVLHKMNLDRSKTARGTLTFEITPSDADDAYGGWWISIYDTKLVELQRATDKELATITTDRTPSAPTPVSKDKLRWNERELRMSRPTVPGATQDRVFLRGIHRKNGAYVTPTAL
jgi:hypothetical protein